MWQVNGVGHEQLVRSQREAARLLNMRPSSVFYWRRIGLLGPAPWTLAELLAVKHRPEAPNRPRGVTAAHGSLSRAGAGCTCPDCRAASAAFQRERDRRAAEQQFPPAKRGALLELLGEGVTFREASMQVGVSAKQIWGRARSDLEWGAQLQATLDRARPTGVVHGRQSSYRLGCRCSECRAAR
jgi:hypothetical protein